MTVTITGLENYWGQGGKGGKGGGQHTPDSGQLSSMSAKLALLINL